MKKTKIMIAGVIISTNNLKKGIEDAQKVYDNLYGEGKIRVDLINPSKDVFVVKLYRQYPEEEGYDENRPLNFGTGKNVYFKDASILAGNNPEKQIVNFGFMPFVNAGYSYYLTEADIKDSWNEAGKRMGFSQVKKMNWTCSKKCIEVTISL